MQAIFFSSTVLTTIGKNDIRKINIHTQKKSKTTHITFRKRQRVLESERERASKKNDSKNGEKEDT